MAKKKTEVKLYSEYAGEWVVVYNDKVVAHNLNLDELKKITIIDGATGKEVTPDYILVEPK